MSDVRIIGRGVSPDLRDKVEGAVAEAARLRGVAPPTIRLERGKAVLSYMAVREAADTQLMHLSVGAVSRLDPRELTAFAVRELSLPPVTPAAQSQRAVRFGGAFLCTVYGGALVIIPAALIAVAPVSSWPAAATMFALGALLTGNAGRLIRKQATITRRAEYAADAAALRATRDPDALVAAIEKEPPPPAEWFGPLQRWAAPVAGHPGRADRIRAIRQLAPGVC